MFFGVGYQGRGCYGPVMESSFQEPSKSSGPSTPAHRYGPSVSGNLVAWFETGLEGFVWTVQEPGKGYDGLHVIQQGDRLVVRDAKGAIAFEGVIEEDRESCWTQRYPGATHGQPCVDGYWVHWTQRGVDPSSWVRMFTVGEYSAELQKKLSV